MKKKNKWFRLDNAAKIFPPTSTKKDPRVFRFSCTLKEMIEEPILKKALDKTIEQFPGFKSVMKKGLFWYYLEESTIESYVTIEKLPPCSPIYNKNKHNLLFRVTYYQKRINLEVYHALTDGTGALQFLKTLVSFYLHYRYPNRYQEAIVPLDYDASNTEKMADSFDKYYQHKKKQNNLGFKRGYQLKGEKLSNHRMHIIEGNMSVKQVLQLAHQYQATMTSFLIAIYIKSILDTMSLRDKKYQIGLLIPVNLRSYFQSVTARNFFSIVEIDYQSDKEDSLENIVAFVNKTLKEKLEKENIEKTMNAFAALEHNFLVRLVPLFLKDLILKISSKINNLETTAALSNVGKIEMPEKFQNDIDYFEVYTSTERQQICICSYLDKLNIAFTSVLVSTDIIKNFFRTLTNLNIEVEIISNQIDE